MRQEDSSDSTISARLPQHSSGADSGISPSGLDSASLTNRPPTRSCWMTAQYAAERNDAHADMAVCRKDGMSVPSVIANPSLRTVSSPWSVEARAFACWAKMTTVSASWPARPWH